MPGAVVGWPRVLSSVDCEELLRIAMDTYDRYICSEHGIPAPCHCPRTLNRVLPIYIDTTESPFDPLNITVDRPRRIRGVATYIGLAILVLTLADKASQIGMMI